LLDIKTADFERQVLARLPKREKTARLIDL
jgi:hypothetical protein